MIQSTGQTVLINFLGWYEKVQRSDKRRDLGLGQKRVQAQVSSLICSKLSENHRKSWVYPDNNRHCSRLHVTKYIL